MHSQQDTYEVNLEEHPTAKALVERCTEFFAEVQNLCVHHAL